MGRRERIDMEMNACSFIAKLAGSELRGPEGFFSGRCIADSRLIRKGDIFVAFKGENTDGHKFVPDAIANGAALIICENDDAVPVSVPSVRVHSTYEALPEMARRRLALQGNHMEIIAVTGSVGKTTTRDFLVRCLRKSFRVHSAEQSYNTLIGCSMTILSLPADAEILVLEMGTNHPGEITEMVRFFPPTLSIVTETAPAHLEGFRSLEGVLSAKMEIAGSSALRAFFFNGDNCRLAEEASKLPSEVKRFSVGMKQCDYRILNPVFRIEKGAPELTFSLETPKETLAVKSCAFGNHAAYPLAFALGVSTFLGVPAEQAKEAVKDTQSLEGRGRIRVLDSGACLVDDSYNANPASMSAVLKAAAETGSGRHFAVVGEMLELGDGGEEYHRELLPLFGSFDSVWLIGRTWEKIIPLQPSGDGRLILWKHSLRELGEKLRKDLGEKDTIVVKGSHGNRLDRLVDMLCGGTAL